MANNNMNTRITSVNRKAADEFQHKAHAEDGIHLLSDTAAAPSANYYGFIVTSSDVVISSITYNPGVEGLYVTGDTDFSAMILPQGLYVPIKGGFSTLTLGSGSVILLKHINKV